MGRVKLCFLTLAVIFSSALLVPQKAFAQLYVGTYAGAALPHKADASINEVFIREKFTEALLRGASVSSLNVSASDAEYDPGLTWGVRVGYWMEGLGMPFLGLETEFYTSFPKISDNTLTLDALYTSSTGGSAAFSAPIAEAELDLYTVGLNLLARYPKERLQPYGGAGLGIVRGEITKLESVGGPSALLGGSRVSLSRPGEDRVIISDVDDTSFGLQLIGGLKGFIDESTALTLEYRYLTTDFDFRGLELDYDSSHVLVGIEFFTSPGFLE